MSVATIDSDATRTPNEIDGVVSEHIVGLVTINIMRVVVPDGQAIVAAISYVAVINSRVACALAKIDAVGEVVAYAAVDNLKILAVIGIAVVVAKPKATFKMLFPNVVDYRSFTPNVHKTFINGFLRIS